MSDPKLIALMKANTGDDWIVPSIISIYNSVEKIVIVHSDVTWTGRKKNDCERIVMRYVMPFDYDNKIINLHFKGNPSQTDQCNAGMRYIYDKFRWCDRVMIVDTDEIWNAEDIRRGKEWIKYMPKMMSGFCSRMRSYIKSPFYRVNHLDHLTPMIFVPNCGFLKGDRGMKTDPVCVMENVVMHHFCFVRRTFDLVLEKLINSHTWEGQRYVPIDYWIINVWGKLPDGTNDAEGLHPAMGFQNNWKRAERIGFKDLPEVLQRRGCFPIIEQYADDAKDFDGKYYLM